VSKRLLNLREGNFFVYQERRDQRAKLMKGHDLTELHEYERRRNEIDALNRELVGSLRL
jgi:hypothetical protein